jgi:recombination protein RecT
MALKTVLKNLLSKYGILSIDMQNAIKTDQAVINDVDCEDIDYIDVIAE